MGGACCGGPVEVVATLGVAWQVAGLAFAGASLAQHRLRHKRFAGERAPKETVFAEGANCSTFSRNGVGLEFRAVTAGYTGIASFLHGPLRCSGFVGIDHPLIPRD